MANKFTGTDFKALLDAADPQQIETGLAHWRDLAAAQESAALAALPGTAPGSDILRVLFGYSPYLGGCLLKEPEFTLFLVENGPEAARARALEMLRAACHGYPGIVQVSTALRIAKRRIALTIALADIAGLWTLDTITGSLSDFAAEALNFAAGQLLKDAHDKGRLRLPDPENPCQGSGFIVIGMGKLGARELNYSSDIDLIILFDPEIVEMAKPEDVQQVFVRITRGLVKAIDERTGDGYVFRTDLRLRPDPGSTPAAISVLAAETYYESIGQNWERAAMIKARAVAGDIAAGTAYLDRLKPFIWRRNLDFATIQDVHSIKRQINAHRGGERIQVNGHNIKLGRGGIREVEFFAQTQQLIWGGRKPNLRPSRTEDALVGLLAEGHITEEARDALTAAYRYLRQVEHRLQMIDDNQTQELPKEDAQIARLAGFLGHASDAEFRETLVGHLRRVEIHYAALFEDAPDLSAHGAVRGNLVFTGAETDPDTLRTLEELGFSNPAAVDTAVRGWHHARYRSTRSNRTRQALTELLPTLLAALSKTHDPNRAFLRFDDFLSHLPAGVQLFSMFHAEPRILELVAEVMGSAPRLAHHLAQNPGLLESVLISDIEETETEPAALRADLGARLKNAEFFEDLLNISRRWANDRRFVLGVQTLRGAVPPRIAAEGYSHIADTIIAELTPFVVKEFAHKHGTVPESGMSILAMGKLGSREMTPTSDLDLIFVYSRPDGEPQSDGARPLSIQQYYARFSQRLINALSAPTAEGSLFEVDMRLRPSGNAGPIACGMDTFFEYQEKEAWTWEHMALTRARPILGSAKQCAELNDGIRRILCLKRDPDALLKAVADMRNKVDAEHHSDFPWECKHRRGGLVDIEFIAQYLQLLHAHDAPEILDITTMGALKRLAKAGLLDERDADTLIKGLDLWQSVQGMLRLTIEGYFETDWDTEFSSDVKNFLTHATGFSDFDTMVGAVNTAADEVLGAYERIIDQPAAKLA